MSYLINVILFIIIGIILFFSLKKQKRYEDKYFGRKVALTKKELKILEKYKAEYIEIKPDSRLPSYKKEGFELVDIAKSATEMIYDNPIPTLIQKEKIKIGDLVKLKFIYEDNDIERMWIEVIEKEGLLFKALLRNDSFFNNELVYEKELWFHINHIFEIENK